jgi:hypothetical protein
VLTYNLGAAAIRAATTRGMILERSFAALPDATHQHHYRYRLDPHSQPWTHWNAGDTLGVLRLRGPARLFTEPRAGRWWLHARRLATLTAPRPTTAVPERFALRLAITPPNGWRGHLCGLVKPVTDGLIAAMHTHDGDTDAVIDRAPTVEPDLTPTEFGALLQHPPLAPLGRTRLVVPWRSTLQWLPADDRFVALDVRLALDDEPGTVIAEALDAYPADAATGVKPPDGTAQK